MHGIQNYSTHNQTFKSNKPTMPIINLVYEAPNIKFNWDLSKATSANMTSFSVPTYCYNPSLSADGTKLFVSWHNPGSWETDNAIIQYTLTTPYDITTATNRIDYAVWYARSYPWVCFADNWLKLFLWYWTWNTTYARYDLSTAYDLSNVTFSSPSATFTLAWDLWIYSVSADGKTYLYLPWTARSLTYTVSTTARSPVNSQTALLSSSNVMAWTFCNEWKMLMVMDWTTIKKYGLWTAYDLSTLNTTPIQSQSSWLSWNPRWIHVDKYWDNIYILAWSNTVYRFNLA